MLWCKTIVQLSDYSVMQPNFRRTDAGEIGSDHNPFAAEGASKDKSGCFDNVVTNHCLGQILCEVNML